MTESRGRDHVLGKVLHRRAYVEGMGFFSSLFGKTSQPADFEQAKAAREAFLATVASSPESDAFNAASGLMLDRKFEDTIEAYTQLAARFPERRGDCLSQIGAAQYFLGLFDKAIESYVAARAHGADASMMDDNIWEACEALHSKGHAQAPARYLELCPEGAYVKKARKLSGS